MKADVNVKKGKLEKSSGNPEFIRSPVFLAAAERSGTTLLRLILDHHPQITWVKEFGYAVDWVPTSGWPDLNEFHQNLAQDRIFCSSGLSINLDLGYVDLVNDFLVQWRNRAGKPIVGAQVHRNFDKLLRIWPEARFIHLVRDPRDVARSRVQAGWAGNTWRASQAWIDAERQWSFVRRIVSDHRQIDVYFENLVREPEQELRLISQFIGVRYDAVMLEFHRDTTYDPVDSGLSEQWRNKLTKWQVQLVEADAAEMMMERGYRLSGYPRVRLGRLTRMLLKGHDKLIRTQFRMRKYGALLWLADLVSRRIGLGVWRQRILARVQAVDRVNLK